MTDDSAAQAPAISNDPALVTDVFRDSVRCHAHRIAIEIPPSGEAASRITATYEELASRAFALAHGLLPAAGKDRLVAVLLARNGIDLYAAQLAALYAGAAWVCLDAGQPDQRLRTMLLDARPVCVLTAQDGLERVRGLVHNPDIVTTVDTLVRGQPRTPPSEVTVDPQSLAYVIYTSGTTGRPKGVMIEHHSLAHLVASDVERFALRAGCRVAQGSSPIYDSSIEETWLALAVGGTIVVMEDEVARAGPDIIAWLRNERIHVFCPPPTLLRSTGCAEPWNALPELTLLYVGGEPLTPELADTWGRDRWLENGYGPTECTVTVVRGRIEPGAPITIGAPIQGHAAWILDESLEPVLDGVPGELCISGPGLARGYINDPELTASKFPDHPVLGRICRTGDRAVQREGLLTCLGRMDGQVKIRGHRVELADIDSALASVNGVRQGACFLQASSGADVLEAWIVPLAEASAPSPDQIRFELAKVLPPHMVPARIAFTTHLPTTAGGKLDRRGLPPIALSLTQDDSPRTDLEERIASGIARVLGVSTVPVTADFFNELGGDSLRAAMAVSLLREDAATQTITVRDLYEAPTARAVAARLTGRVQGAPRDDAAPMAPPNSRSPWPVGSIQALCLMVRLLVASSVGWWVVGTALPWLSDGLEPATFLLVLPAIVFALALVWVPLSVGITVLLKRLLIGKYRPGRTPAWGWFHLRHWVVQMAASGIPWALVAGTVFHGAILRRLGARVGQRVHIHRGVDFSRGGWDLLSLGDDVTLGQESSVRLVETDRGDIVVGPVTLGDGATLDIRAGVEPGTRVDANGFVGALSVVESGGHVPNWQRYDGVPAVLSGASPIPPPCVPTRVLPPIVHGVWMIALRGALAFGLSLPSLLLAWVACTVLDVSAQAFGQWISSPRDLGATIGILGGLAALDLLITLPLAALACRWIAPRRGESISRWAPSYARIWLATGLVDRASRWLSGTLLWPWWLRTAGMRVGAGCEISTLIDIVPGLLEIEGESFLADGIYLGPPRIHRGVVTTARTHLGRGTFLGNHAVIPCGAWLPEGTLHGVCTIARESGTPAGSSWFGLPAFELPRREVVKMPRELTHDPSFARYWTRVFFETMRFALPTGIVALGVTWVACASSGRFMAPFQATLLTSMLAVCGVLLAKWLLLGRVKPGIHALWSCWCGRWDLLYVTWGMFAQPVLRALEQTPWMAIYLRLMGCRIGSRTLLGRGFSQVVDPDMIDIRDGATVNGLFQAHSFEDRVLKIDRVVIRERATIGSGSVLLYGADVGRDAQVTPHSVVMKRERLRPARIWRGAPTEDGGSTNNG